MGCCMIYIEGMNGAGHCLYRKVCKFGILVVFYVVEVSIADFYDETINEVEGELHAFRTKYFSKADKSLGVKIK